MAGEKDKVDAYLDVIERLEPNLSPIDKIAAQASMAISLKRIADSLEVLVRQSLGPGVQEEKYSGKNPEGR